jgi:integrase/recombinase XerC
VQRYLEYVRVEKRLAARTVTLYALDLEKLRDYAGEVPVDLLQVQAPTSAAGWRTCTAAGAAGAVLPLFCRAGAAFIPGWVVQGMVASNPVQDVRAQSTQAPAQGAGCGRRRAVCDLFKNNSALTNEHASPYFF